MKNKRKIRRNMWVLRKCSKSKFNYKWNTTEVHDIRAKTKKKKEKREDLIIEKLGECFMEFEQVESYDYLGTIITENGDARKEREARVTNITDVLEHWRK